MIETFVLLARFLPFRVILRYDKATSIGPVLWVLES